MRPLLILSSCCVIGCGPGQRPRLDTEHLTFHGELDGTCGALGRQYEREVDRLAHELGRGLLDPVDVYVGYDEIERRCPPGTAEWDSSLAGCVVSDTEVATTLYALSKQLVQVTRDQHEVHGIPFIENALPYMFGVGRPITGYGVSVYPRPHDAIAPQLAYGWSDEPLVDNVLAVHFLHWMEQAYGSQAFHAWLWSDGVREGEDVEVAFTEATGQTIAVAQERWRDDAELYAMFGGHCHGLPAPPLSAEGLLVEVSAPCCDDPEVEQFEPPLLNTGQRCFTLPTDTEVDVEMLAGEGTLVLRPDGCGPTTPSSPLLLLPGEATTVTMTACRWWAMVVGPERCEGGETIRYAVTPS